MNRKFESFLGRHAGLTMAVFVAVSLAAFLAAAPGINADAAVIGAAVGTDGVMASLAAAGAMSFAFIGDTLPENLKELEARMKGVYDAMQVNVRKSQDTATEALEEVKKLGGTIEGKTQDTLKAIDADRVKVQGEFKELRDKIIEVAQKLATKPGAGSGDDQKSIFQIVAESDQFKAAAKEQKMHPVEFPAHLLRKTQIVNAEGTAQPLVNGQRLPGVVTPIEQRLFIRDVIPQGTASGNLIEFAVESAFTNAAAIQGGGSPVQGEGELKAESAFTFALSTAPVVTIAHWVPASRQVLSDAPMLQGYLGGRLMYGLKLVEESQILTGTGSSGTIAGLIQLAASFTGGVTNQTVLDTMLKAFLQVSLSNFEASAVVMHPTDWTNAQLLKDTQGRYIFTNPQDMTAPRLWSKPVVASQSMSLSKFLTGAFNLGAQIWDREAATVRISENVNDHFIRNLVAILVEERMALTVYRPTAFVSGSVSYAG